LFLLVLPYASEQADLTVFRNQSTHGQDLTLLDYSISAAAAPLAPQIAWLGRHSFAAGKWVTAQGGAT